ncbi:uncharacterized protein LOC144146510 [Haemaphysalis longicornis]
MLVAVFLVLVGVIAAPLVVFICNGTAGELPFLGRFFGGKNDTAFGNLSLAAVTQAAPVGGESVSPPDSAGAEKAPQSAVKVGGNRKDLRLPTRPPSGMAKGAHGLPAHHGDNSNRERVYAPGVETASTTTKAKMDLVEVQALTEQVIVVPKGGVMSKLRVAAVTDDEENPKAHVPGRRRMPVRAAGVESAAGRVSTADTTVATLPSVASPRVPQTTSRPVKKATSQSPSEDHPSNASITKTPAQPSTITSTTSSSSTGRARQGPLNNGNDDGSVWRTILPPKNPPTSTTVGASSDTGVGVEYYDDSKNDSVSDGNADARAGDSDATLHKRRIGGEIDDSANSSSKKSDVFQTEYYYDDVAPSSKPEESTKDDTTVAEYENAPEQDRIDDLFF